MSNYQSDMRRLVDGFVSQLSELWRRQAIDALGGQNRAAGRAGAVAVAGIAIRPRGKGAKRTAEDLEKLSQSFMDYVKANPGLRIEQINKELGTTTKDLALPIRKLIADGAIKAKGQKRSTTYFAGDGAARKRKKN